MTRDVVMPPRVSVATVDPAARTLNWRSIQSWPPALAAVRAVMSCCPPYLSWALRVLGDAPPECSLPPARLVAANREEAGGARTARDSMPPTYASPPG